MKTSKASLLAGFTLVEIMIVVTIIGILAAIGIPSFVKARSRSQATACINNSRSKKENASGTWSITPMISQPTSN
jgi:prepilin-type N-terminal cleavage/methylation domain-containing protein